MRKAREFRDTKELKNVGHQAAFASSSPAKPTYRARLGNPVPPTEFQRRINNWQRACRWIRSADTNYTFPAYRYARSNIGIEIEYCTGEALTRAPYPIDWEDAWDIELAWRELSPKAHWVIKMDLHMRKKPKHACRLMRRFLVFVHYEDWATELDSALLNLERELDMRKLGVKYPVVPRPGFPIPALKLVPELVT